ncbi:major facilitator superfamily domain-containing protein [Roridomyces roridus]|uniref:Major facilitator superfamily domain-containing protein n=1 Tax=Roridomyces roridus TaxID=1738132 RepID=A0AAD7FAS5_9AGAR|nr:major facilitator superfamily domain-containing protein [Roridomyces roridus]
MSTMPGPDLARSDSTATGTSIATDIQEKEKGLVAPTQPSRLGAISEGEEEDNVGYSVYREGLAEQVEMTLAENRAIVWRLDLTVLMIFLVTQTLQFLDKTALNYANLFGFQQALGLTGDQFNWLAGMVYFGYAVTQYPIQILIGKYPAQKILAVTVFMWGLTVLTMVKVKNFHTAMANRFVLGMFEASVSPSLSLMTGWWYTRREIPLRQFIWYSALGWGGVIGSYISTGISRISPTAPGPEKWQSIFYILGSVTMLWSVVIYFFFPDSPATARFLTPRMRVLAVQRVAGNQLGIKNKRFKREQVWVALKDFKIWILFASIFAAAIPNGVLSNFSAIIIQDMGFSTTKTTVLKSVGDITQIVALIIGGIIALNFKDTRLLVTTITNVICVVASATMAYLPREQVWGRLVSFWLTNTQSVGFAASLIMVSSNMGGYTHRTVASGILFTAYCFGNFAGPFVCVKQSQAPVFHDATIGLLAGYTIKLVCQLILWIYMYMVNRRRDKEYGPPDLAASKEAGMQDKTEYENKDFRYVL